MSSRSRKTKKIVEVEEDDRDKVGSEEDKVKEESKEEKTEITDQTSVVLKLVDALHNILRKDAIVGIEAYHDINKLLFLRFIQPHLSTTLSTLVDPTMYKDVEDFNESILEYLKNPLLLCKATESEFEEVTKILYKRILNTHPLTKEIFKKNDYFRATPKTIRTCLTLIIKDLKNCEFDKMNSDIKGVIYEHFLNGYANTGKEFGQFFTPRPLIRLILSLNEELFEDFEEKKISSIYDPCMGTAGFLTEAYKYLATKNIANINLYGTELDPKAYMSGIMNVLLTTGSAHNLECKNSLSNNTYVQFDCIVTNPPFGIKGIKYDEVLKNSEVKAIANESKKSKPMSYPMKELYPIKTNDICALFLQHCIEKLNYYGICNIVLPDGQIINSKPNVKLRKHLIEECDLKAVLSIPGGTFTHAAVSTVVLFFSKYKTKRTNEVKFYEAVNDCKEFKLLCTVEYDQIAANTYILNYKHYMPQEERNISRAAELKPLGEICELIKGKHSSTHTVTVENGNIKFITLAFVEKWQYVTEYDFDDEAVFIGYTSSGRLWPLHYYSGKYKYCNLLYKLKHTNEIKTKYLYYYLLSKVRDRIQENYIKGAANKSLDTCLFKNIQIPVPSLEVQEEIIANCEIMEESKRLSLTQIENTKKIIEIYNRRQIKPMFDDEKVETKLFGEIIEFLPKRGTYKSADGKEQSEENKYRFYTCASEHKYIDTALYTDDLYLIINRNGNADIRMDTEFSAEKDHIYVCKTGNHTLTNYVYYYLSSNLDLISDKMIGMGIKGTSKEKLNALKIPVPSMEAQKKIIATLEMLYKSIDSYTVNINEYEKRIAQIINFNLYE